MVDGKFTNAMVVVFFLIFSFFWYVGTIFLENYFLLLGLNIGLFDISALSVVLKGGQVVLRYLSVMTGREGGLPFVLCLTLFISLCVMAIGVLLMRISRNLLKKNSVFGRVGEVGFYFLVAIPIFIIVCILISPVWIQFQAKLNASEDLMMFESACDSPSVKIATPCVDVWVNGELLFRGRIVAASARQVAIFDISSRRISVLPVSILKWNTVWAPELLFHE